MGHKVHPIGFRIGITKDWRAKWYAEKQYTDLLLEDLKIRGAISSKYAVDDLSNIDIERSTNHVTVTIHTARPGIVIGRGGQRVDEMRAILEKIAGKRVKLNIVEIAQPELDAYLIARSIAQQIERRISHRRAMKQAIARAMERGAQGIKITCAGRISGSEYARKEKLHQGRVPLHTLRADIDYALAEAHTTLGRIGVKVWVYKGDIIPESEKLPVESSLLMTHDDSREKASEVPSGVDIDAKAEVAVDMGTDVSVGTSSSDAEDAAGLKEEISVESSQVVRDSIDSEQSTTAKKKPEPANKSKVTGEAKKRSSKKSKTGIESKSDIEAEESKPKRETEVSKPEIKSKPIRKAKDLGKPKVKAATSKKLDKTD